jgi:ABC-2 type transport system permease protein
MRTLRFLLRKEFRQIFRNRPIMILILAMPVIQLILLPLAADYEVKNINLAVVDGDHSTYSQKLIDKITASGYFKLAAYEPSFKKALGFVERDQADLVLEIPAGFERTLVREGREKLFVAVNAINGSKASLGGNYLISIISDFNQGIRVRLEQSAETGAAPTVDVASSNWYNVLLNYKLFMVPGVLATLLTMISGFLAALNIVKEKEVGTIEQINVTPIRKHHFILGKLIPFWIMGNVVFLLGLLISYFVYGITPAGSLALLWLFVAVYLVAVLGFGLLVSTFCDTQQQAMFIMFFFIMIFILLGGLFTPTDSMPGWAQVIVRINPVSYLITVMRMVIMKGSGMKDVLQPLLIITGFALGFNTWAVWNYRKAS